MKHNLSKKLPLIFLFFIIFFYTGLSKNNDITFKRFSIAEGLSQGSVYDIFQDSRGFMWFGTRGGGLNKYDSYSFHAYKHKANDSISISSDHVYCMTEDKERNPCTSIDGLYKLCAYHKLYARVGTVCGSSSTSTL